MFACDSLRVKGCWNGAIMTRINGSQGLARILENLTREHPGLVQVPFAGSKTLSVRD